MRTVNLKLEKEEFKDLAYIVNTLAKVFIMMMDYYFQRISSHFQTQVKKANTRISEISGQS